MRKCINVILICLLLMNSLLCARAASSIYFYFNQEKEDIYQNDDFTLSFSVRSNEKTSIGTFSLTLNFDAEVIEFKKLKLNGIADNEVKYMCSDGELTVIYLRKDSGITTDPIKDIKLFDVKFKTKENADLGTTNIRAKFDGLGDVDANPIDYSFQDSLEVNIKPPKEYDCTLQDLVTLEGDLTPEFSPDITNYSLNVPYKVDRIDVYAQPNDSSATVKVSRKTLQKAGVPTIIKVTVTSKDKSAKLVYQITVNRSLKEDDESFGSTNSKSSKSPKSSNGSLSNKAERKPDSDETASLTTNDGNHNSKNHSSNKSIHIKDNDFNAFLTGMILSIVTVGLVFTFYMYKKNKRKVKDK